VRRAPFFIALLGLVACGGGPGEKPATPHHVDTNGSSPKATDSESHWLAMLGEAYREEDAPSAALSLTVLAERWPEALAKLPRRLISYGLGGAEGEAGHYRLYRAILGSAPGRELASGGFMWRELALLQLGRGEQKAALASLAAITDPYVIISVEADRRFDGLRASIAPPLDVQRGANQSIDAAREAMRKHPDQLQAVTDLLFELVTAARFADALQVADAAAAKAGGPRGPIEYTDYNSQYVWLLDNRAMVLAELGRWTEAVTQFEAASRLAETGSSNVSQVINLAGLYNDLGQAEAARQTLKRLPQRLSPYGYTQLAMEQLRSAVQLGDQVESTRALVFLREHQADSPYTYERALLELGRPDEAAQVLIKELHETQHRSETLLRVQHYAKGAQTPKGKESDARWQAMQSLPEVREAIAAVGHVGSYPVTDPRH